jgi:hypothetical protein
METAVGFRRFADLPAFRDLGRAVQGEGVVAPQGARPKDL